MKFSTAFGFNSISFRKALNCSSRRPCSWERLHFKNHFVSLKKYNVQSSGQLKSQTSINKNDFKLIKQAFRDRTHGSSSERFRLNLLFTLTNINFSVNFSCFVDVNQTQRNHLLYTTNHQRLYK